MYKYNAIVRSVYDGDTIRVDIDLGCSVWLRNEPLRLYGINAPEVRGKNREAGFAARDYLREMILDKEVIIETRKDRKGKYGRYLADIYLLKQGEEGIYPLWVNNELVVAGHAERKDY
jgi:micrococcal nuclease